MQMGSLVNYYPIADKMYLLIELFQSGKRLSHS
ncbi:hypothetical protein ABIB60_001732 [Hymenobacter sp. UYP22]